MDSMAISMVLQVLGNRRRLLTLAFAFPVLRSCGDWMNRITALENGMHLNTTERGSDGDGCRNGGRSNGAHLSRVMCHDGHVARGLRRYLI
jgi:hypothetical protein